MKFYRLRGLLVLAVSPARTTDWVQANWQGAAVLDNIFTVDPAAAIPEAATTCAQCSPISI